MKQEKTETTTITKLWDKMDETGQLCKLTECFIVIEQDGKFIKLEEEELKALEKVIGGRFKQ